MVDDAGFWITAAGASGGTRALISMSGAGLHALHVGDRAVMPGDTERSRARWFSGPTLAPWPNRICDGRWSIAGGDFTSPANDGLGNALHGLVFDKAFDVVERRDDRIVLEYLLGADAAYPWAVRVRVSYVVDADGLACTFGAVNESDARVPFAIGTHPYFAFDDGCTLTIDAEQGFAVDDRLIPTGAMLGLEAWGAITGEPFALAGFTADDCFTGHRRDALGRAHTVITYPDGASTDVWQDAAMGYTVVFVTRDFEWSDGTTHAIAIEPQTAPTNAFNTGTSLIWLEPGAECAVQWGITYRPRPA